MTHSDRMKMLFLLAWSARMAIAPMAAHWGVIGGTLLVGIRMSWAASFTLFLTITLSLGCLILVLAFIRDPAVQARMRGGGRGMLKHSFLVLLAAAASNVGGMALLSRGEAAAAGWAMGLGTFVMICEVAALIGSTFASGGEPSDDNRTIR